MFQILYKTISKQRILVLLLFLFLPDAYAKNALKAYRWEIVSVESHKVENQEFLSATQTSTHHNHGGEIKVVLIVFGYSSGLVTTFNAKTIFPYNIEPIDNNQDNMIDSWKYYYRFHEESGTLQINDFGLKKSLYIR